MFPRVCVHCVCNVCCCFAFFFLSSIYCVTLKRLAKFNKAISNVTSMKTNNEDEVRETKRRSAKRNENKSIKTKTNCELRKTILEKRNVKQ